eukprot:CAMPEP_0201175172 /NCGR_PEP_ID=MMETSP0851-20130426/100845_1 /ASSEMBLY_ACC=CAM_ASM_000631 /TAXON_ID=183588 /ORGANISM="Pseudo-nitzschia fraudulenta, Strain WWA7" /LENGTH=314 /DNA_ID=CAMNT_0047458271 /DNA_START=59 /DNA_END=1003 /DNA_ORIENTATION=-
MSTRRPFKTIFCCAIVAVFAVFIATIDGVGAFPLQGKTVLVTGSGGGIGKGIARVLAESGAKIILHYHTRKEEANAFRDELGPEKCLGVLHCDFRDIGSIPSFFREAQALCRGEHQEQEQCDTGSGKLDVLVNNAGAITKMPLGDDDDNLTVWRDTMAVNLHAPNLLGKFFAEQFRDDVGSNISDKEESRGVVLNVGSIHGERSNEYMGAYAASKAALESLTRTMAMEYASLGVRANLIAPGIVPVERTEKIFEESPEVLRGWTDKIPLGRAGSVDEVARACLPLIENEWITGVVWQIDGGMMARANMPVRPRP